jgi:hypothetical protein
MTKMIFNHFAPNAGGHTGGARRARLAGFIEPDRGSKGRR